MSSTLPPAPRTAQSVWLVAEREVGSKLRSKAFVISFLIQFAVALALVVWGGFSAGQTSDTPVAVTADIASQIEQVPGLEVTKADTRAEVEKLVLSGDVDAGIISDAASPVGITILAESDAPTELIFSLAQTPPVQILQPDDTNPALRYFVALGFGLVFFLSAMTFGSTIAQSVVEEKQTRVVELLISAIPTRALLAGKVLGNTILAMAQILVLAGVAVIGLNLTGQVELLQGLSEPLIWFAVFFLLGFVLLASMYAAAAAMVSRQEDIGSTTTPLVMLVMAPYLLVIIFNDNPTVLGVMSYVPFSAPVGMPVRIYLGQAQWWEPLLSLLILAASCVVAILLGAKIYQNSLLRMGARVKLAEALKG